MNLEVLHIDDLDEDVEASDKLPLHKDEKFIESLKKIIVAKHNEKIRKQKSRQLPVASPKSVNF